MEVSEAAAGVSFVGGGGQTRLLRGREGRKKPNHCRFQSRTRKGEEEEFELRIQWSSVANYALVSVKA